MAKKEITVSNKEFWELLNRAIQLFGSSYGIPNGTYLQRLETSPDEVKLVLTETEAPKQED